MTEREPRPINETHVRLKGVGKRFGGVEALYGIDLQIARGSLHGLVGENGAGKSTLAKIIAGVVEHDEGELRMAGRPVRYRSPRQALRDGVTMIAQELTLVPQLSVIRNVFLGVERGRCGVLDTRDLKRRYASLNERAGFGLPATARAGTLRVADQQKVEIMRALARDADLIVMDEPTAALSKMEAANLFEIIRGLNSRGTTIIYVSHFLDEVLNLVDRVTVLRDGRLVRTSKAAAETPDRLVTSMLGRSLSLAFPPKSPPSPDAPVVVEVRGLRRGRSIDDISFEIRAGEILGLAGLIGSGRSEVARAIFGADRVDAGEVRLRGKRVTIRRPPDAIREGIAMLPESRKTQGLIMRRSIADNISLPDLDQVSRGPIMLRRLERKKVLRLIEDVEIRPARPAAPVASLSGGNQQKVLFAKWLFRPPQLLLADEPTRGVDVGAKRAIYQLLTRLASEGMAVLLISSELEEVLGLAHRVLVMRGGRIVGEFHDVDASEDAVMASAFGTELLEGSAKQ